MRYLLILAVACIALAPLHAQDDGEKTAAELSLVQAVNAALDENVRLKQSREQHLSALSNLRIASFTTQYALGGDNYLTHSPDYDGSPGRVVGSLTYEDLSGASAALELSPLGFGSSHGGMGLQLRKPLMQGKGLLSEKRDLVSGAQAGADIADREFFITQQYTVRAVIHAYYRAVLERERVAVEKRALDIALESANGTRRREEEGLIVALDVTRAEMRVAQTRDSLVRQQQSASAAMDALMLAIGTGVGERPDLTDPLPEGEVDAAPVGDAIRVALANRAELSVFDLELQEQARKIALAADEMRPELDAVLGFNSRDTHAGWLSASLFEQDSLTVGVEYRFPIDRRISREKQGTAERQLDVLHEQRTYQMEEIAEQVWNAYRQLESAQASLGIQTENLAIARQKLHLAQRMVDEGESDNRDVLEAQSEMANLESSILGARTQVHLAGVDLKYYMGENITALGVR